MSCIELPAQETEKPDLFERAACAAVASSSRGRRRQLPLRDRLSHDRLWSGGSLAHFEPGLPCYFGQAHCRIGRQLVRTILMKKLKVRSMRFYSITSSTLVACSRAIGRNGIHSAHCLCQTARTRIEQISSAVRPIADIRRCYLVGCKPGGLPKPLVQLPRLAFNCGASAAPWIAHPPQAWSYRQILV